MEWKSAISINVVLFCFYRFISLSNPCELYKCCFITKSSPAYFEHFCSSATVTSVLATQLLLLLLAFCPKQTVRAPAGPRNSALCSIRLRTDLVSGMLVTEDVSTFPHNTGAFFFFTQVNTHLNSPVLPSCHSPSSMVNLAGFYSDFLLCHKSNPVGWQREQYSEIEADGSEGRSFFFFNHRAIYTFTS